jgi:hypothetical protein
MADPDITVPAQGGVTISQTSSERAPIIYFDGVSCMGQHNGAIQIELAANLIMPASVGVRIDVIQTDAAPLPPFSFETRSIRRLQWSNRDRTNLKLPQL